ncbi:AraC family transcriptional regulator [Desertivirga xinjiangensis]|uniref:AraC family transcriptional regulator n=1 Tax=Desertivirga xinjiangensis TaxID=539206 RepID=UPI00210D15F8|nr:helix-turn-helix domain-containing protein [Pedobacter xinjiangensis]
MGLLLDLTTGTGTLLFLLFCIHLFFAETGNRVLNRLLIIPILARVALNTGFLLINSQQLINFPYFLKFAVTLSFAVPACFYLYIHYFINDLSRIRKKDLVHFIIPVLAVIDNLYTWFFSNIDLVDVAAHIMKNRQFFSTIQNGFFPAQYYYFAFHSLFIVYLFFAWRDLFKSGILHKKNSIEKKWLLTCLIPASLSQLISISPLLFLKNPHAIQSSNTIHIAIVLNCLVFFALVVFMIHHPRIMYGYLIVSGNKIPHARSFETQDTALEEPEGSQQPATVKKLNLTSEQAAVYIEDMNSHMEENKPFLNSKFQIIHLAHHLDIPAHHCSFIINNVMGKNFRDWVNGYRVEYFIQSYRDKAETMTIDGIAYESGFNSITTFYRAFKKETGMMPLNYLQRSKVET